MGNTYTTGNITGTGIAVGEGNQVNVTMTQQNQQELAQLLEVLKAQVQKADLPDSAKQAVLAGPVQQMQAAVKTPDPKPAMQHGFERINDQLQVLGVTASRVEGIVGTLSKIASVAGVALHGLPFLAGLL